MGAPNPPIRESWEIDPRGNGVHSLAEALRSFDRYEKATVKDRYDLADAVLRSHQALETLLKLPLFTISPPLAIEGKESVARIVESYRGVLQEGTPVALGGLRTVGLSEATERLRTLGFLEGIEESEYGVFLDGLKRLKELRDALQHFAISADKDYVSRILGIVLPTGVEFIECAESNFAKNWRRVTQYPPNPKQLSEELEKLAPGSKEILRLLRYEYNELMENTIRFFRNLRVENLKLELVVSDEGRIGAGPYHALSTASGWLSFKSSRWGSLTDDFPGPQWMNPTPRDVYEGRVIYDPFVITNRPPKVLVGDDATDPAKVVEFLQQRHPAEISGGILFEGELLLLKAGNSFVVPGAEDHFRILRDIEITVRVRLQFKGEGHGDSSRLDIRRLVSSTGSIEVHVSMVPRGYSGPEERKALELSYAAPLDSEGTTLELDAFTDVPNVVSREHPMRLRLSTRATGVLEGRKGAGGSPASTAPVLTPISSPPLSKDGQSI